MNINGAGYMAQDYQSSSVVINWRFLKSLQDYKQKLLTLFIRWSW